MTAVRWLVSDSLTALDRNLRGVRSSPDLLSVVTIQPVMFVVLFVFVFGGAINTPGLDYVDFLMPGILIQTIVFGSSLTTIGLASDMTKGIVDRFRSLPMAKPAVLVGRTLADGAMNAFAAVVMIAVGLLVGFDFKTGVLDVIAGIGLMLLVGFAFSWVAAVVGLALRSVEAAQTAGFLWLFPLTFASSAFVPVESMPAAIEAFAQVNPITLAVDALRHLFVGTPAGNAVWGTVVWCVGLLVVFVPLAVARYGRVFERA